MELRRIIPSLYAPGQLAEPYGQHLTRASRSHCRTFRDPEIELMSGYRYRYKNLALPSRSSDSKMANFGSFEIVHK